VAVAVREHCCVVAERVLLAAAVVAERSLADAACLLVKKNPRAIIRFMKHSSRKKSPLPELNRGPLGRGWVTVIRAAGAASSVTIYSRAL